jgi:hypothetical protein
LTAITERSTDASIMRRPSQPGIGVTRTSALGSHGPDDNLKRSFDVAEQNKPRSPHTRRNTLPSLVITDQMAQVLANNTDMDPLNHQGRQNEPADGQLKRRSRSADALNRMLSDFNLRNAGSRNRESDIAYWRKSIIENPLPANVPWQLARDDSVTPSTNTEDFQNQEPPLQTFDFGLERPSGQENTIEDRVNTLEVKMFDFEYAIAKLQGHDIPKPMYQNMPKRRSIHDLFPGNLDSGDPSSSSSQEPTSFLTSPDDSPLPRAENEEMFRPDRSSKATTIRPLTAHRRSAARSPSPVRITIDQFDQLMNIIRREQNSRRQLEAQVNELQMQLEALRTPVYAEIRPVTDYPTPSPDSRHDTPGTNRTLRRSPPFPKANKQAEQSRFSMSEVESDTDGYDEVFETPQDNKFMFEQPRSSPMIGVS